jgi:asparagine synthase (glutamine-hydrolysing)
LKGPLREILFETLSEETVNARGLLNAPLVSAVKDQFLAGTIAWPQPWLLMMIELWAREVLDRPMNCSLNLRSEISNKIATA